MIAGCNMTARDRPVKTLLCICAALTMTLIPIAARAATDVTGAWTGEIKSPDGSAGFQISFTFKQDGDTLTGSVQGAQGDPIAISDGKIDGDKVTFKVAFNGMTITHQGTVSAAGDEIKLTSKSDQGDFPGGAMTLKRAKAATP
jgi:hypothetical protein